MCSIEGIYEWEQVGGPLVARHLTRMLQDDEPVNLQGALADVVTAQGGLGKLAAKVGLAEWRFRLILWDQEEAWKLVRLAGLMKTLGLRLVVRPWK